MAISNELRKLVDPNNECCCEHCLSNKCKEWAHKLGFMVQSYQYNTKARVDLLKSCDIDEIFIEETEPEAIFKACDYIINELSNK